MTANIPLDLHVGWFERRADRISACIAVSVERVLAFADTVMLLPREGRERFIRDLRELIGSRTFCEHALDGDFELLLNVGLGALPDEDGKVFTTGVAELPEYVRRGMGHG